LNVPLALFVYVACVAVMVTLAAGAIAAARISCARVRVAVTAVFAGAVVVAAGGVSWKLIDGLDRATRAQAAHAQAPNGSWGVPDADWVETADGTRVWPVVAGKVELIIASGSWHGVRADDRYVRGPGGWLVRCDAPGDCVRMAQSAAERAG